jgi:uncharacterized protein (UPF0276 family)
MNHHTRPYGVGLAYRYILQDGILRNRDSIDLIEIPTEDYICRRRRLNTDPHEQLLTEITKEIPAVAHGISLSIGSVEPVDQHYLDETKKVMQRHNIEVFSEHLAFHRMDGRDLSTFLCMPFEEESVQWIKANYNTVREVIGRPFSLENVTYHFPAPNSSLREADFLRRLTEETDCTLLLDATNVFNNSHNHNYDPMEFLDRLPLDRVAQIHLAGGEFRDGKWEDCHNSPVMEPVWGIFEEIVKRSNAEIVVVERDSRFKPFENILDDVHKAREIFYKYRPEEYQGDGRQWAFPETDWDSLQLPDITSDRYKNLRGFQRAVLGRITNPEYRKEFETQPETAMAKFGLDEPWQQRVSECDAKSMEFLARSWEGLSREVAMWEDEHKKREWAAWANILQHEANAEKVNKSKARTGGIDQQAG